MLTIFLILSTILTGGTIIPDEDLRSVPHINPTLICPNQQLPPNC